LYGTPIAKVLEEFQQENDLLGFKAKGLMSKPDFDAEKNNFILFINSKEMMLLRKNYSKKKKRSVGSIKEFKESSSKCLQFKKQNKETFLCLFGFKN
jgi:hypothetical protein